MQHPVNIFLFLALPCEAKPLIAYFGLKKLTQQHVFECYQHDNILLTISGIGKNAMAAAVGYTLGVFNTAPTTICINIGIAGHQQAALGSLLVADKIIDYDSGKCFYPQLAFSKKTCPSTCLTSVSKAQTIYAAETLYDMEAAAFYEAASRFTSSELLLCVKVVSDNASSPMSLINAKQVSSWIAEHTQTIAELANLLHKRALIVPSTDIELFHSSLGQLHLSVNEKIQLKALLSRWQVLSAGAALPFRPTDMQSARELLSTLARHIEELPIYL